jgi:hypothetical protein
MMTLPQPIWTLTLYIPGTIERPGYDGVRRPTWRYINVPTSAFYRAAPLSEPHRLRRLTPTPARHHRATISHRRADDWWIISRIRHRHRGAAHLSSATLSIPQRCPGVVAAAAAKKEEACLTALLEVWRTDASTAGIDACDKSPVLAGSVCRRSPSPRRSKRNETEAAPGSANGKRDGAWSGDPARKGISVTSMRRCFSDTRSGPETGTLRR